MEMFADLDSLSRVLLCFVFILIAAGVSRYQKADVEKDLLVASIRAFIQLILISFALEIIFQQDNPLWTFLLLTIMTSIATYTTGQRVKHIPNRFLIAFLSIACGTILTMSILLIIGIFQFTPNDMIPIGGMIIGNAMTTTTLVMIRLSDDINSQSSLIEAQLALGASSRQASLKQFRAALRSALVPIIDTTRTVGLIKLPGAMTGMILAGASPMEAVQLQIVVMYMLVGATTFAGLIAALGTSSQFFNAAQQLQLSHIQTPE